jgi:hypothetical protein
MKGISLNFFGGLLGSGLIEPIIKALLVNLVEI